MRAVVLLLALIPAGRATASYDTAGWKFSFLADGMYSSNVNFASGTATSKEKQDVFAVYKPSIGIKPDVAFGDFELNAGLTAFTYVNRTELNRVFSDSGGRISVRVGRRLQISAADKFTTRPVEFGKPTTTSANLTSVNEATGSFVYDFPLAGKDHLYLNGTYSAYTLIELPNDYYRFGGSLNFERRMSGRLKINFIQSFNQSRFYDKVFINTVTTTPTLQPLYTMSVGSTQIQISYRTGPKLESHLAAGASITRVAGASHYAPTASGGIQWTPSSRATVYSDLGYAEQIDTTGNAVRFLNSSGRIVYRLSPRLTNTTTVSYSRVSLLVRPLPLNAGGDPNASYLSAGTDFSYNFRKELNAHVSYNLSRGFEGNPFTAHSVAAGIGISL